MVRSLTRNGLARTIVAALAAQYIRLIHLTGRWRVIGEEIPRRFWDRGQPFLVCFWHGRLLMMPYCRNPDAPPVYILISRHPDGRFIADTIKHFGVGAITGSTSRGGTSALRAVLKILASGATAGITPDGPRGPRMRAGIGAINAARMAGVAILPITFAASRRIVFNSWDRFVVALPFAKGVLIWGDPIEIARDADHVTVERARRKLEDRLNALCHEADRLVGAEPIEPAPEADEGLEYGAVTAEAKSGGDDRPEGLSAAGGGQ
ncbi:MAG: lysophospholipid acyltransferase family protein [Proteobacteria bacterium]|nr:lysophospholipid acyltransferase family protein [Pseudomonadota bacterium]